MWFWTRLRKQSEEMENTHTGEIELAQKMRDEATNEMWELKLQKSEVTSLLRKLARRRELNHFGEELTVSFRPRGPSSV